ncbi:MAG: hypothetical protein SV775_12460 [Thermodesulfobacteriota bacterium]|nr:hypothetical protein [Thermodesulfobacteriota bacterium]
MRHKKKSKREKSPALCLLPKEEELVASLIRSSRNSDPAEIFARIPDSRCAQGLVEQLCLDDDPSMPLLSAIHEGFEDKNVRKAVRRALFKLKKRGAALEGFLNEKNPPPAILRPPQREKPATYLGPVNAKGSRAVLITFSRSVRGLDTGVGFVSDEEGIYEFLFGTFSKKRTKELKDHITANAGPLVETSLSHGATILEDAYKRHLELHSDSPPSDYLKFRPWLLENASLLSRPIIYDFMPGKSLVEVTITNSQLERLFQHELMKSWLVEAEGLRPLIEDILKAEASPIVLTPGQKSDRAKQVKQKCVEQLFPGPKRALLAHRLKEMAYFFLQQEESDLSSLCLAAASCLDEEDSIIRMNPVIEFLLERSIALHMELSDKRVAEEETPLDVSSPRIVLP